MIGILCQAIIFIPTVTVGYITIIIRRGQDDIKGPVSHLLSFQNPKDLMDIESLHPVIVIKKTIF